MTRQELEAAWESCYVEMVAYANRRMTDQGQDIVQTAYINMLAHETYLKQPVERARIWIWWKVKRDMKRIYDREMKQIHIKQAILNGAALETDASSRDDDDGM